MRENKLACAAFILSGVLMTEPQAAFDVAANFEGLEIRLDKAAHAQGGRTVIEGLFSTFVPCGSQYAVWHQFPGAMRYEIRDLDSDAVYQSIDNELSISWHGNQVYGAYAKKPCDRIIAQTYAIDIEDMVFLQAPPGTLKNFEIRASYYNTISNVIQVRNRAASFK